MKTPESPTVVSDLTRFLLKKDLLFSRFLHFNDKPETFNTWKTSFKSITEEIQVTPFEEMDLLVKFLGPPNLQLVSEQQIQHIQSEDLKEFGQDFKNVIEARS